MVTGLGGINAVEETVPSKTGELIEVQPEVSVLETEARWEISEGMESCVRNAETAEPEEL